jgi:RHS repeat-associated protein
VVALSNRTGRIVRTTEYDPWGKVLVDNTPSGMGIGGPVSSEYEFVGGYGVRRDVDGKSIMGVRMYDAGVGRFTSQDPLGFQAGDTNLFKYVWNNSINQIDPNGLDPCFMHCRGVARILREARSALGRPGAFDIATIDSAAIIPDQWGGDYALIRKWHKQISGAIVGASFSCVADVIGSTEVENVRDYLQGLDLNKGLLIIELFTTPKGIDYSIIDLTIPSEFKRCPTGTRLAE